MYSNLKLQIWRSGIRQNRLARELKIDETVLSKVINGHRMPSPILREMLADYFEADEQWLFRAEPQAAKRTNGHNKRRNGKNG
jgi:transcriptional regulator with XRE-family HTH domain